MDKKKKEVRFSSREVDILYILWNAGKPMLASEILAVDQKLKPATVNTALKKMLEKELVVVADFVKSGNVYGRRQPSPKKILKCRNFPLLPLI